LLLRLFSVLSLLICFSGCSIFASKQETPDRIITSKLDTSRYFARNVSALRGFDRMTTLDLSTNFSWWDSTGTVRDLRQSHGIVTVVYFWNTSSEWSRSTAANLSVALDRLRDSSVRYIGVLHAEGKSDSAAIWRVQKVVDSLGLNFQHVIGNNEFSYAYGGINVLPTTFVIARTGRIYQTLEGQRTQQQLEEAIRKTLSYTPGK
jgi:peroxiredoxin